MEKFLISPPKIESRRMSPTMRELIIKNFSCSFDERSRQRDAHFPAHCANCSSFAFLISQKGPWREMKKTLTIVSIFLCHRRVAFSNKLSSWAFALKPKINHCCWLLLFFWTGRERLRYWEDKGNHRQHLNERASHCVCATHYSSLTLHNRRHDIQKAAIPLNARHVLCSAQLSPVGWKIYFPYHLLTRSTYLCSNTRQKGRVAYSFMDFSSTLHGACDDMK